jgi:hypothetical protein
MLKLDAVSGCYRSVLVSKQQEHTRVIDKQQQSDWVESEPVEQYNDAEKIVTANASLLFFHSLSGD